MTNKKKVHFIGICGVAMAPVAKMYLDLGWQVSGSDVAFWPPMSDYLRQNPAIRFYPGWHPEKIGQPDLVIVGNFIGPNNPEFKYIKEKNMPFQSYPEALREHVIKEKSIVVAGTYAKTTISALLIWILENQGLNPSYMSGGILNNMPDGVRSTDSKWSVVEGDEYPASRWEVKSKFFYYQPKCLVLTSADWDHMDIFKTEADYIDNFRKLVAQIPTDGIIVANKVGTNLNLILNDAPCPVVYYKDKADYHISLVTRELNNFFMVENKAKGFLEEFETSLVGLFNIDNLLAGISVANELGFDIDKLKSSVASFKGVRRRLDIRGKSAQGAIIVDDLAHSPVKAKGAIMALKDWYPNSQLYAIFEPNVGSRTKESLDSYNQAFKFADEVIIPRLSTIKSRPGEERLDGQALADHIKKTSGQTKYIGDDDELVGYLKQKTQAGDVIVFLGSHGFRGMIEELLSSKP